MGIPLGQMLEHHEEVESVCMTTIKQQSLVLLGLKK